MGLHSPKQHQCPWCYPAKLALALNLSEYGSYTVWKAHIANVQVLQATVSLLQTVAQWDNIWWLMYN